MSRAKSTDIKEQVESFFNEEMPTDTVLEEHTVTSVPCVGQDNGFTTVKTTETDISQIVLKKVNGKWSVVEISTSDGTRLKRNVHYNGFTTRKNSKKGNISRLRKARGNQHYTIHTNYRGKTWREDHN